MTRRRKKKKAIPYTQKTKDLLHGKKYLVDDTERKNCWNGHKNDLFGFGDLLAVKVGMPITIVQSTSGNMHTSRVKKILGIRQGKTPGNPQVRKNAMTCLKAGMRIVVISWSKVSNRWQPRVQQLTLKDFI